MEITNSEKIILKPEDWTPTEWKIFCRLVNVEPANCASIQIDAGALTAYKTGTQITHAEYEDKTVLFETLPKGAYFRYNNQFFVKSGTDKDNTNAIYITKLCTPTYIANCSRVNVVNELQLEYKG